MILDIRHMHTRQAVVQEGTVTRAAHRLHVTQPALSHQLKKLEDRLETLLFQRNESKMLLTASGHKALDLAESVLGQVQHTEEQIRQASQ